MRELDGESEKARKLKWRAWILLTNVPEQCLVWPHVRHQVRLRPLFHGGVGAHLNDNASVCPASRSLFLSFFEWTSFLHFKQ